MPWNLNTTSTKSNITYSFCNLKSSGYKRKEKEPQRSAPLARNLSSFNTQTAFKHNNVASKRDHKVNAILSLGLWQTFIATRSTQRYVYGEQSNRSTQTLDSSTGIDRDRCAIFCNALWTEDQKRPHRAVLSNWNSIPGYCPVKARAKASCTTTTL